MEADKIEEIRLIGDYITGEYNKEPQVYCDRLQLLSTYIARTGVLLAEAKQELNVGIANVMTAQADKIKSLPASQVKIFIQAQLPKEYYLVDLLDRLNTSCVHQSENLRTLISYAKEEMKMI